LIVLYDNTKNNKLIYVRLSYYIATNLYICSKFVHFMNHDVYIVILSYLNYIVKLLLIFI